VADGRDGRHVEVLDALALRQELAAVDVLVHHQPDVVLVVQVVVEGEGDQAAQRVLGLQVLQVQFGLDVAHRRYDSSSTARYRPSLLPK
jgi:hypothetical protein